MLRKPHAMYSILTKGPSGYQTFSSTVWSYKAAHVLDALHSYKRAQRALNFFLCMVISSGTYIPGNSECCGSLGCYVLYAYKSGKPVSNSSFLCVLILCNIDIRASSECCSSRDGHWRVQSQSEKSHMVSSE